MKKKPEIQNIVAKYAHQFNKAAVFKDKTQYNRKEKHKKPAKGLFYCSEVLWDTVVLC